MGSEIVVMGDFNFEQLNEKRFFLREVIQNYQAINVLPKNGFTTDSNTQIDVIFSNVQNKFKCGTYESYFSDHKCIFYNMILHPITNSPSKD